MLTHLPDDSAPSSLPRLTITSPRCLQSGTSPSLAGRAHKKSCAHITIIHASYVCETASTLRFASPHERPLVRRRERIHQMPLLLQSIHARTDTCVDLSIDGSSGSAVCGAAAFEIERSRSARSVKIDRMDSLRVYSASLVQV